ncbi:hypothetical protein LSTR_LSTR013432 [Laodelphax striatellus]|uniref:YDG domain-containing protein n=1 Tax=Laodelphax striatellus TaxID=195883 RepID=A0A482WKI1_LAOST|nr:hypothetical protein LSTR_LSTR013432 [Laodelphax striatellus]
MTKTKNLLFTDVAVGDWWLTSRECWHAGVHRPPATGASLHCGPQGAYSVTLSDQCSNSGDVDGGERFTLSTGGTVHTGGETIPPAANGTVHTDAAQPLSYDTVSLVASMKSRQPVRVVRSHKLASAYAPDIGYRYDGLYNVENYWVATSKEGATVYKFLLQRLGSVSGQAPPPWLVHKIVPPSLHRAVQLKYAQARKSTPGVPQNAVPPPARLDARNSTLSDDDKICRKALAAAAKEWALRGGDSTTSDDQQKRADSYDQLFQKQKLYFSCRDQLLSKKKLLNSCRDQLSTVTSNSGAMRMQASPSTSRSASSRKAHLQVSETFGACLRTIRSKWWCSIENNNSSSTWCR